MADASSVSAWTGAATTSFGVVLGFLLNGATGVLKAHYERRGHWLSLRADIIRCGIGARGYLDGGVMVPAGRMPMGSFTTSYPALLMAELLSEDDMEALSRFFGNVEGFNRSLDFAQNAIGSNDENLKREVSRAELKASKVVGGEPQYLAALTCVQRHLRERSGHWLLFWK